MSIQLLSSPPLNVDHLSVDKWWDWYQRKAGKQPRDIRMCPPYVGLFKEECEALGINWLVLWCQFVLETGFGQSKIYREKLNMFGLGAVDSDPQGGAATFRTARAAVRAGAQHLAVYAGSPVIQKTLQKDFVLERTAKLREWGYFGLVKFLADMGGKSADGKIRWASDPDYGRKLTQLYESIVSFSINENPNPEKELPTIPAKPLPKPEPVKPVEKEQPAPVPTPLPVPKESAPPAEKPKIPFVWKIVLKTAAKYGGTLLIGLLAGVSPPVAAVLTAVWKAIEHWIASL